MNRLVLIGNGFDLAHGLKTSYADFIRWYYCQWGNRLLRGLSKIEEDGLCSFKIKDNIQVANWASVFQGWYYKRDNPFYKWDPNEVFNKSLKDKDLCDFSFTSPLLKEIWNRLRLGWVDIENEYYSLLIRKFHPQTGLEVLPEFKELNKQFEILRNLLIEYLKLEEGKKISTINGIENKIFCPIKKREISIANIKYATDKLNDDISPSNIMLLNFNYTRTPEYYIKDHKNVKVNYIHGKLDNPHSVIFGYGDELDDGYEKLKNCNDNECLRYIKSILYLESDSYRKVLDFIETAPFQIFIMGHSCGNSDRTLLNTLFEHRFCSSIKPYFYKNDKGEDNYLNIVQNISRNFNDMKLMRDRVVIKPYCEPLSE